MFDSLYQSCSKQLLSADLQYYSVHDSLLLGCYVD